MKILVCGGRYYKNNKYLVQVLDALHKALDITSLVHGNARGADTLAAMWAYRNNIAVIPYPADWEKYGNSAGIIRNALMLKEERPEMVVAFPGGSGTDNMVKIAKKARVPVIRYDPDLPTIDEVWEDLIRESE